VLIKKLKYKKKKTKKQKTNNHRTKRADKMAGIGKSSKREEEQHKTR